MWECNPYQVENSLVGRTSDSSLYVDLPPVMFTLLIGESLCVSLCLCLSVRLSVCPSLWLGTADAEIKVSSSENTELSRVVSFKLWTSSEDSVGTYPETSSHATCQGTFSHSRLSSLSHCGPILA